FAIFLRLPALHERGLHRRRRYRVPAPLSAPRDAFRPLWHVRRRVTPALLGVVTARGGSKSIPGKNLNLLHGKPLIAYPIEASRESGVFDRLILSTDDPEIAATARVLGCEAPFLRPADLARDDTLHLAVMQHAVAWLAGHPGYRPAGVMIVQATETVLGRT